MTERAGLTIGWILIALCAVTAAGIALFVVAHKMPSHTDRLRATELTIQYEQHYLERTPEQRKPFEREIAALRTSKWELHAAGLVMCLSAPVLLAAIVRFRLWDIRNLRTAATPRTQLRLLGLASVAWWALLPAFLLGLDDEYKSDDLTPTMDAGQGSALVFLPPFFLIVWVVMLVVGRFVVLRSVLLPASLWCWDGARPNRSLVWTGLYGILGGIFIILIAWSAIYSPWALPSFMVGLYVIVSTRAALLNPNPVGSMRSVV